MRTTPALTALSTIALIAGLSAAARAQTHAGTWPAQAVRIVTPFPPGSGGDITARPFADRLAKLWGKPVIVENRPGADGIIAVTSVLNSTNGHTILYTNGGPLTSNQISHAGKLPYEPMNDLLPISGGAEVYVGIGVPASLPVGTVADFLALAKLQPGQFNWGGTPGSLDYLIPGFFKNVGVDLTHVPYRDVTSAMQDLSQARLQLYAAAVATQLPMAQAGKVKIIAVTNRDRAPGLPDVPTADEAGFPDLRYEAFLGFFGPRGMSADAIERISSDLHVIATDRDLAAKFNAIGMKMRITTPAELKQMVVNERAALAKLAPAAGAPPAE
ncbi:tripartite tricarboxylate transporter substrate binding protein [Bradyrhizobium sp. ISRA443]|uniref:Bug family tripartite tricarboxylate transporter substrate binding protein n=1 Tax=unclassified Bradyrhizobium TaxID=2631580 RepID=UPI0024792162|nr:MULTISPECIES: tripartite tricarboxylate transporter substrate binding protein [unclassified Bradyrhizobium]WGR98320.1 tripartite tricarboxylate transporter substrate binding protein [Bradyrhizobium sp. ISRA436]WGS05208.1 tripartite tricarboxylate transporter substrate binding protein [Bradyrhizobium sp. ISRA437]WGS12094.1 tripartite tricarboxylate transporter substrate binding protein [Bradyrhizobium sp. ISRA443]